MLDKVGYFNIFIQNKHFKKIKNLWKHNHLFWVCL